MRRPLGDTGLKHQTARTCPFGEDRPDNESKSGLHPLAERKVLAGEEVRFTTLLGPRQTSCRSGGGDTFWSKKLQATADGHALTNSSKVYSINIFLSWKVMLVLAWRLQWRDRAALERACERASRSRESGLRKQLSKRETSAAAVQEVRLSPAYNENRAKSAIQT